MGITRYAMEPTLAQLNCSMMPAVALVKHPQGQVVLFSDHTEMQRGLVQQLTNCRNGLELLLASHEPDRPDDPWDTINELRETVRKSTEEIDKQSAAQRIEDSK